MNWFKISNNGDSPHFVNLDNVSTLSYVMDDKGKYKIYICYVGEESDIPYQADEDTIRRLEGLLLEGR